MSAARVVQQCKYPNPSKLLDSRPAPRLHLRRTPIYNCTEKANSLPEWRSLSVLQPIQRRQTPCQNGGFFLVCATPTYKSYRVVHLTTIGNNRADIGAQFGAAEPRCGAASAPLQVPMCTCTKKVHTEHCRTAAV